MYTLTVIAIFGLIVCLCVHGVLTEANYQKSRKAFDYKPFWQ